MTRISIVTAVYNRARTVGSALQSIHRQDYPQIQSVVIDGMSTDGTSEIIQGLGDQVDVYVRESDQGIYDALNKGIRQCDGDVIGFLHADDTLASADCMSAVAEQFTDPSVDIVFGDLVYVREDDPNSIVRYWQETAFQRERFRRGWMPPHPTVYARRHLYEQLGGFRDDLTSAADYECLLRFMYKNETNAVHLPKVLVKMRVGGQSNASLANRRHANREDRNSWVLNGLDPPPLLRLMKPMRKLPQYWKRPASPLMDFPPSDVE